jgi:hypothetical protein
MGRARNAWSAVALDGFATVLGGARRGSNSSFTEVQLDAAAEALKRLSDLPDYWPLAEARAVLEGGTISRGDAALREFCGLPDEDYSVYAAAALKASALVGMDMRPLAERAVPSPGTRDSLGSAEVSTDRFAAVLGVARGAGDTRLDRERPSELLRLRRLAPL